MEKKMNFYLDEVEDAALLLNILEYERMSYKVFHKREESFSLFYLNVNFIEREIEKIEINTYYEKFQYIKYLYHKELKKQKKKQKQLNKKVSDLERYLKIKSSRTKIFVDSVNDSIDALMYMTK